MYPPTHQPVAPCTTGGLAYGGAGGGSSFSAGTAAAGGSGHAGMDEGPGGVGVGERSLVVTEYHFLVLAGDRLSAVNRVSGRTVQVRGRGGGRLGVAWWVDG